MSDGNNLRIDEMSAKSVLDLLLSRLDEEVNWEDPIVAESINRALSNLSEVYTNDLVFGLREAILRVTTYFYVGLDKVVVNYNGTLIPVSIDVLWDYEGRGEEYLDMVISSYTNQRFEILEELRDGYDRYAEERWSQFEGETFSDGRPMYSEEYKDEVRSETTHLGTYFLEMLREFPDSFDMADPDVIADVVASIEIVSQEIDYSAPKGNNFVDYVEESLRRHQEYAEFGLTESNFIFNDIQVLVPQDLVVEHDYDLESLHEALWDLYLQDVEVKRQVWLETEDGIAYQQNQAQRTSQKDTRIEQILAEVGDYELEVLPGLEDEFADMVALNAGDEVFFGAALKQATVWAYYLQQLLDNGQDLSTAQDVLSEVFVIIDAKLFEGIMFQFWIHRDQLMIEGYGIDPEARRAEEAQREYDRTREVYVFFNDIPPVVSETDTLLLN